MDSNLLMKDLYNKEQLINNQTFSYFVTLATNRLTDKKGPRFNLAVKIDNMHLQKVEIFRNWH